MITPQNIKEKTFEKAVFGGYDMASVDNYLDEISTDLALLQKDNATLKAKIKVLVDKVEEYRSNEDAIRMAIVSAQRLGTVIENEAKENAAATLAKAEEDAERIISDAQLQVKLEQTRLSAARKSSVQFVESMKTLCSHQSSFLEKISEMDFMKEYLSSQVAEAVPDAVPETPANPGITEIHETVKSIEETVAKVADEPVSSVRPDIQAAPAIDEVPTRAFHIVTDPEDDLEQTAQFSFDGFGR